MTALTNQKIQTSYQDLIQVSNSGLGIDATLRAVSSGLGTASPLQLSTTACNVQGTFKVNGVTLAFGTNAITWVTTGPSTITLPTTGTMATLAGAETLTNKTIASISSDGSHTVTFPTATDTLTGKATTDTLTNKTYDTAGTGNVFKINGTAVSAVSGSGAVVLATSPTLITPALGTVGSGNISACTSTSMVMVTPVLGTPTSGTLTNCTIPTLGVTCTVTNDSTTAGHLGEVISSTVLAASAVSLTNNTGANVTSISLTAGDWEVFGNVLTRDSTNNMTSALSCISATSATLGDDAYTAGWLTTNTGTEIIASSVPTQRISLASTTTYYLVVVAGFSGGTATACGSIHARRVR